MKKVNLISYLFILLLSVSIISLQSCKNNSNENNTETEEENNKETEIEKIDWNGRWIYVWEGGENEGGVPISISYSLTINGEDCQFEANGYGVMGTKLKCKAVITKNEYIVYFEKDLVDNFEVFKRDKPMLTIKKEGDKFVTYTEQILEDETGKELFAKN